MLDVITVQEIELTVEEQAARMEEQFQSAFNAPLIMAQLIQLVLSDPRAAEELKRADPEEYERVVNNIKRMKSIATGRQ